MICPSLNLVYLHPSKTGGTSIETALMILVTGLPKAELTPRISALFACWDDKSSQHLPYARMLELYPFIAGYRKIVTVRHPYDRAISEFRYQLRGCRKSNHPVYRSQDINLAVTSGLLWNNGYPWHGQPQINYVAPGADVLRLETLADDWSSKVGLCELPHLNKTDGQPFELSDAAKDSIRRRFPLDFEPLGYSP